jgi:hypothetical protein
VAPRRKTTKTVFKMLYYLSLYRYWILEYKRQYAALVNGIQQHACAKLWRTISRRNSGKQWWDALIALSVSVKECAWLLVSYRLIFDDTKNFQVASLVTTSHRLGTVIMYVLIKVLYVTTPWPPEKKND